MLMIVSECWHGENVSTVFNKRQEAMDMRASRSQMRDATNVLTATPDEFALGLACALLTARDRLSLRLSCRRFNIKCIAAGGGGGAAQLVQRRQRRRCCVSWTRRGGCGWRAAASRSAGGYRVSSSRAGCV